MKLIVTSERRYLLPLASLLLVVHLAGIAFAEEADADSRSAVLDAAARIDALVSADLAKHNLAPNAPVSDEVFLRRTYLAITGMIPSYNQAKSFLESETLGKRAHLIDRLLESEGYVNQFSNLWADTLRVHSKMGLGEYYRDHIKSALRINQPYDELVSDFINAEGSVFTNGEVGFYLRDRGMPLDHMANLVQVFLGTRIQCAQCHDHPSDNWTQYNFYEMAAFTHSLKTEFPETKDVKKDIVDRLGANLSDDDRSAIAATIGSALKYAARRGVHNYGVDTELKLPDEYEYSDGEPGEIVPPRPLFGPKIKTREGKSDRTALARWLVSADNPLFAKVIANRLWKVAMGRGIVEPIDDFHDETSGSNAALLDNLFKLMIDVDYDMKRFLRVVFNTETFQRSATRDEIPAGQDYHFRGPVMRRASAEQVWDSMMAMMMEEPLKRRGAKQDYDTPCPDFPAWSDNDLFELAKAHPGITKGGRTFRRWLTENSEELKLPPKPEKQKAEGNLPSGYFVSSQLEMPLKPGHFLRQFGQSDRMMIDGAHRDPTIPQVLSLLNGPLMNDLVAPKSQQHSKGKAKQRSHLEQNIDSVADSNKKLDVIFISLLGRYPTDSEHRLFDHEMTLGQYADVVWVLVNSHEFLFVQ